MTESVKKCTGCEEIKPLSRFYRDKYSKDGHLRRCRDCVRRYHINRYPGIRERELKRAKDRRINDPEWREHLIKESRKFFTTPFGRANRLYRNALKSPTTKRTGCCTLTFDHVLKGVERGTCAVTGINFDLSGPGNRTNNPFSPSLDRIDPTKPYTNENVRVVIWQFNVMKGEISDAQLYLIANMVIKGLEEQWQSKQ